MKPLTLFDESPSSDNTPLPFTGQQLATIGAQMALDSANQDSIAWGDECFKLLQAYIRLHGSGHQFQAEDARLYCEANKLTEPPSKRAYGGLIRKLKGKGLIKWVGVGPVLNYRAHMANAAIWEVV